MPRTKKPRKIGSHTNEQMKAALQLIDDGMPIRMTAKVVKIPYATLRRYFQKSKNLNEEDVKSMNLTPNYSVNRVFSEEQESTIKDYLNESNYLIYGLTNLDLRKFAYETAILNKLKIPECWNRGKIAGIEWMRSFRSRHPELILRAPETGTITAQKLPKTLAPKRERAFLPAIIFPRTNLNKHNITLEGELPGNLDRAAPSGWVKSELLPQKMKPFMDSSLRFFDSQKMNLSLQMENSNEATSSLPIVNDKIDIETKVLQPTLINAIPKPDNENPNPQAKQETFSDDESWFGPLESWFGPSEESLNTEKTTKSQNDFQSIFLQSNIAQSFINGSSSQYSNKIERRKTIIEESIRCMRAAIDASVKGDGFAIFGKNIAQKLRTNKKEEAETKIAKLLIDNVLQNLSIGIYNSESKILNI